MGGFQLNSIQNMMIWGNHSNTITPDITYCKINNRPLSEIIKLNQDLWQNFEEVLRK